MRFITSVGLLMMEEQEEKSFDQSWVFLYIQIVSLILIAIGCLYFLMVCPLQCYSYCYCCYYY